MNVVELTATDIDQILVLEQNVCIPPIQASRATVLKRFLLGNKMLGLVSGRHNELVSSIAFRAARFSPNDQESFPRHFAEYSTPSSLPTTTNSVFVYSFNVAPKARERGEGFRIIRAMSRAVIAYATQLGYEYLVGDGRLSSYNGSDTYEQESIPQVLELKKAVDEAIENDSRLPQEAVLLEPTLKVYSRFLKGFKTLWLAPNFLPSDKPAGGHRIIFYCNLSINKERSSS